MAAPRHPLDHVMPWLVAATVFAFACGSSSVASITHAGHVARWVLLVILLFAAAARAVTRQTAFPIVPAAAATALVGLALVSAAWSVSPRLSVERAVSLGILFAAALLLAAAEDHPWGLLAGLVGGATTFALAGLLLLGVDHSAAVQAASIQSPARFRGLGQDANTACLLFALALPPALGLAATTRNRRFRVGLALAALVLAGSIVASGSRGALFASGAGVLVVALVARPSLRRSLALGAVVVAAVVLGLFVQNVPKAPSHGSAPPAPPPAAASIQPRHGYLNAEATFPLNADVGGPLPGGGQPPITRGFFGGSGRLAAWKGTVHQILQRPLLGFGFGTEAQVFVDRYYYFVGGSPEDSYLGISLQLGLIGLAVLAALVLTLASYVPRALGRHRTLAAACAGTLIAGLVIAVVQSYVYSVGNIGTSTLWIAAFLLPQLARAREASDG